MTKEDIEKINKKVSSILNEEFLASKDYVPKRRDWLSAYWSGFKSPEQISRIRNTGYVVCVCQFSLLFEIFTFCALVNVLSYFIASSQRF